MEEESSDNNVDDGLDLSNEAELITSESDDDDDDFHHHGYGEYDIHGDMEAGSDEDDSV